MTIYKTEVTYNLIWQKESKMWFKFMAISTTAPFSYFYDYSLFVPQNYPLGDSCVPGTADVKVNQMCSVLSELTVAVQQDTCDYRIL
jgi:hypothetical protein